jgi:ribosomal protein L7/L12
MPTSKVEKQAREDKKLIAYAEYMAYEKAKHEIDVTVEDLITRSKQEGFDCRTGKDIDISQLVEKDANIGKNNLWKTISHLKSRHRLDKISLILVVRQLTDLDLKEAKDFVETVS